MSEAKISLTQALLHLHICGPEWASSSVPGSLDREVGSSLACLSLPESLSPAGFSKWETWGLPGSSTSIPLSYCYLPDCRPLLSLEHPGASPDPCSRGAGSDEVEAGEGLASLPGWGRTHAGMDGLTGPGGQGREGGPCGGRTQPAGSPQSQPLSFTMCDISMMYFPSLYFWLVSKACSYFHPRVVLQLSQKISATECSPVSRRRCSAGPHPTLTTELNR